MDWSLLTRDYGELLAIGLWLLTVEGLGLLAWPLTTLAFRKLPDRGYALAKVVGILLTSYLVWLAVSLNFAAYARQTIGLALGLLLLGAVWLVVKYQPFFRATLRTRWQPFVFYECLFVLAFEGFLVFRAFNPDIFWSESSMDFSLLNVLVRADALPPPDPWIAGFPLNYYYFGHFLVATLTKLTGIPPQITYNLAFALIPALVISLVFSLLYNLTRRYAAAFWGIGFAALLGNLDGFFLLTDLWRGQEPVYRFFRPAHEVIPYTIHEFPFWTFIFVDLHAHLFNMPFLLAAFLIGLHLLLPADFTPAPNSAGRRPDKSGRVVPVVLETLLYALLIGTLSVISSWDYPTAVILLLLVAAARFVWPEARGASRWRGGVRSVSYVLFLLVPGSLLVYQPFFRSFYRQNMGLGWVGTATTKFPDFLAIFGFFGFVILSFLLVQGFRFGSAARFGKISLVSLTALGFGYAIIWKIFDVTYLTLGLIVLFGALGCYVMFRRRPAVPCPSAADRSELFVWLCLLYACLITAGCEIVYVRDFLQGGDYKRMNTIFKFYLPVWFLLAIVAAYLLPRIWGLLTRRPIGRPPASRIGRWAWSACFAGLFAMSAVFPVMAVYARRHNQDVYPRVYVRPTLDGLAYLKQRNPDEYQAIYWLNTHVKGLPVILEATGPDYRYEYARISVNTGLPTVLGWKSHVEQREHWAHAHQRSLDVPEIYRTPDVETALTLLRQYQVEYIYVGQTERAEYTPAGLRKFEQHPEHFEKVFHSGQTVIYRVQDRSRAR